LVESAFTRRTEPVAEGEQINHSTGEHMIRNRLVAGGLVVGLLGGGVAGAIFGVPGIVGAQDGTTTTSTSTTSAAPTTVAPSTTVKDGATTTTVAPSPNGSSGNTDNGAPGKPSRDQRLQQALAPLVANGTITQSQADAVIKALDDLAPKGGGHGGRMFGFGLGGLRMGFDTAAKTIGIPTNELMQDLANGQSVADVAKAHNVDPQKVIDALVADAKAKLDKAVAANKITQDQANQILLKEAKVIGDLVNGSLPKMPFHFGGAFGFGHGHGGPGGPGAQGGNAPGSTTQGD
jgi:hypothetical protein